MHRHQIKHSKSRFAEVPFYLSGDYAEGHSIELIPQVGGNLETQKMKAQDW
jgi:hypothetical protein